MSSSRPRRRWPWVVLAVVVVVVAMVGGAVALLWGGRGADEASVDEAVRRFRGDRGTGASGFLAPEPGVYTYSGGGTERLSVLDVSQQWGPHLPVTVTATDPGCWTFRVEYSTDHVQLDQLEEAAACVRSLLRDQSTTFAGEHFRMTGAQCDPRPVQDALPIWIGGGGERRTAVPPDVDWIKPLYAPDYDPLWAVCEQLDVVVNHHSGGGSPDYGPYPVAGVLWIAETTFFSRRALTHLLLGGVFERFPRLRFVVTEQGASWIPPLLAQLDGYHAQMKTGRIGELKYTPEQVLPRAPSEYFARNCWVGASFPSPVEAASRHGIGLDRFMWGSDYPHYESTYPYTREGLRRSFAGTDPSELQQVLAGNAAAVYGFDLEALAAIAARVGPSVDEIDTPLDAIPAAATSPAFFRP